MGNTDASWLLRRSPRLLGAATSELATLRFGSLPERRARRSLRPGTALPAAEFRGGAVASRETLRLALFRSRSRPGTRYLSDYWPPSRFPVSPHRERERKGG